MQYLKLIHISRDTIFCYKNLYKVSETEIKLSNNVEF